MRTEKNKLSDIKGDIIALVYDALSAYRENKSCDHLWEQAAKIMQTNEIASIGITFLGKRFQLSLDEIKAKHSEQVAAYVWDKDGINDQYESACITKNECALLAVKSLLENSVKISENTSYSAVGAMMLLVVCRELSKLQVQLPQQSELSSSANACRFLAPASVLSVNEDAQSSMTLT